jgi:hypothetical protein
MVNVEWESEGGGAGEWESSGQGGKEAKRQGNDLHLHLALAPSLPRSPTPPLSHY